MVRGVPSLLACRVIAVTGHMRVYFAYSISGLTDTCECTLQTELRGLIDTCECTLHTEFRG